MADSVVAVLIEYLSGLLKDEANFLDGVEDRVNSLIAELSFINIFLKNSEGKRNDEIVKEVVRQIRDVSYEAEDVIDSFMNQVAEHRRRSAMGRIIHSPFLANMRRNVGRKIVGIKEKINEIYNNKERYGIERAEATVNTVEEEAIHKHRREVEEDDVVGFVHDSTTLVEQLTNWDPKLDVISIIGMGGLGKTTLAKKIYNKLRVTRHFNCHVWVYVSQDFGTKELLLKILKELAQLRIKFEDKSVDELKEELVKYLKEKRYLIVMDDIWTTEVWDEVRSAFPDISNGSRILITSRNKEVASHASLTPPYFLPFLNKNESWELFRKKVFQRGTCPLELETMGRQIAEDCCGLPLSIVVLAGILAKKEKSLHIWSKFVGEVTSFLITREEDTPICQKILFLSYSNLPRRLKPCFLYFSIYPEDFEIPIRSLMHLWVAEGFVQYTGHRFPEDVAEIYLEELIDRSLIQVASRRIDGGVKTCRIHDLLRELCISESAKEKFVEVYSDYHLSTRKSISRRLSIQGNSGRYMSLNSSVPTHARSLFLFGQTSRSDRVTWAWVKRNFKFLRVIDFEGEAISEVDVPTLNPTFIHLRYLKIIYNSVLPDFIVNLTNLQTLHIVARLIDPCESVCLPKVIFKLQSLRNLYLPEWWTLPCDSEEALGNLKVLSMVSIDYHKNRSFPSGLDKFPRVRKLKIQILGTAMPEIKEIVSFPSLHHLAHLEILRIVSWGNFPGISNSIPWRITKLTLIGFTFRAGDSMTVLGKLPNLRILKLEEEGHDLSDTSIHVTADSFPQLQVLKLSNLALKHWKQETGAISRLRHLVINRCKQFTGAPELLSLTTLGSVEVIQSPSLATMIRELQTRVGFKLLIKD
ncbi:putative disease resistance RPP13-like protein 3 [Corylus avellana]|uniref:putative disease resistance RPP13-like protein 3 n=1 Tax=Corylus avellana TaxID=13451 RepID=UPI00286B4187|nr:putative disease resistance RPP13-like protein 3 [Corylus avellana]